jgi:hypothetical protein
MVNIPFEILVYTPWHSFQTFYLPIQQDQFPFKNHPEYRKVFLPICLLKEVRHHYILMVSFQIALNDLLQQAGIIVMDLQVCPGLLSKCMYNTVIDDLFIGTKLIEDQQHLDPLIPFTYYKVTFSRHRSDVVLCFLLSVGLFYGVPSYPILFVELVNGRQFVIFQ